MQEQILRRIIAASGVPELLDVLAERLSPSDLQSLLLEVYRRRAGRVSPASLMQQYQRDRFVKPAAVSPQQLLAFDQLLLGLLPPGFEALELSPLCPLGTSSAIATVSQNKVVSTIRGSEVSADPSNALALECALRRRQAPDRTARLCASQRVVRAQPFEGAASFAHFRLLCLVTAGRDRGSYQFEIDALREQLELYIALFDAARASGYRLGAAEVELTAFDQTRYESLRLGVLEPLAASHPQVAFRFDQQRQHARGYYSGAGFHIYLHDDQGARHFLADGGFTDWTQQLLGSRKERLLISGLGSERFVFCFG